MGGLRVGATLLQAVCHRFQADSMTIGAIENALL